MGLRDVTERDMHDLYSICRAAAITIRYPCKKQHAHFETLTQNFISISLQAAAAAKAWASSDTLQDVVHYTVDRHTSKSRGFHIQGTHEIGKCSRLGQHEGLLPRRT